MQSKLKEDLRYIADYELPYELLQGQTVLITGATGLVGAMLVRSLLAIGGIRVVAFVRDIQKARRLFGEDPNLQIAVGDIREPLSISNAADFIVHCACVTASRSMVERPVETILTSVEGTKNILELARKKQCRSVVYVSSMEVYGAFAQPNCEITEQMIGYVDPLKVRSNYPESKRLCENLCVAYGSEYGVPVKIARLAQTFGAGILPDENRVFAQFARSAICGQDIVLHTQGLSEGNYCYLRDCVTGLLTVLLKGENGEAYNIANPASHTTIAQMAQMVAERIAGGKIRVMLDIPTTNRYGYAPDVKMKLNSDKLQALGWKPEIGLEESYRRMIADMQSDDRAGE